MPLSQKKASVLDTAIPTETSTVRHDQFDQSTAETLFSASGEIQKVKEAGSKTLKTFDPLVDDAFFGLYKYQPQVREAAELKYSHRFNHALINKAMQTDQYSQLRNYTKLDEVNSALATVTIASKLAETIEKEMKDQAELANQLCEAETHFTKFSDQAASLKDIAAQCKGAEAKKMQKEAMAAAKKAAAAKKQMDQLNQQLQGQMPGIQNQLRLAMRAAEQDAINGIKDTAEMMITWGIEQGQVGQLPPEKRMEIARKLRASDKLRKFSALLGRMKRVSLQAQRSKLKHTFSEIHDITTGSDLSRVLPSELALLQNPITRREFERKFAEGKLLQYQLKGTEKAGKGPVIVCIDGSGSMEGDKEMWAKAVALSLLDIAVAQKRAFAAIQFGGPQDELDITVIKPREKNIIEKVLRVAEFFLNGGTDFMKPLDKAVEIIQESEFKKADVCFITDGACAVDDKWLQKFLQVKKEKEVKIQSVLVDAGGSSDETLRQFSDSVQQVSEMLPENAEQIFEGV